MRFAFAWCLLIGVITVCSTDVANAQPNRRNNRNQEQEVTLPDDERLLALHRNFVKEAEKLAIEYERDRDFDKAKAVYQEILKLVPQYADAREKLTELRNMEGTAEREEIVLHADKDWTDTKIIVQQGKPINIAVAGSWTVEIRAEMSADGITIPEEFKEYPLGCVVGLIDTGNPEDQVPFVIGSQKSFVAEKSGRLFLRAWDLREWYGDNKGDNDGVLRVLIQGTFDKSN